MGFAFQVGAGKQCVCFALGCWVGVFVFDGYTFVLIWCPGLCLPPWFCSGWVRGVGTCLACGAYIRPYHKALEDSIRLYKVIKDLLGPIGRLNQTLDPV